MVGGYSYIAYKSAVKNVPKYPPEKEPMRYRMILAGLWVVLMRICVVLCHISDRSTVFQKWRCEKSC